MGFLEFLGFVGIMGLVGFMGFGGFCMFGGGGFCLLIFIIGGIFLMVCIVIFFGLYGVLFGKRVGVGKRVFLFLIYCDIINLCVIVLFIGCCLKYSVVCRFK